MTTITKKGFPQNKTIATQIHWILEQKGPKTVWEIWDLLKPHRDSITHATISKNLTSMRAKKIAGVVLWKEEQKRSKRARTEYYDSESTRRHKREMVGKPTNRTEDVEVWTLLR